MRQSGGILRRFVNNLGGLPDKRLPAFVVASMGRAGSGLLRRALVNGVSRKRFGTLGPKLRKFVTTQEMDLSAFKLAGGVIYKTHNFPYDFRPTRPTKIIFIFGSASDAAVSVYLCMERKGRQWIDRHFEHLQADGPFEEMFERDVLRFEEQIESWSSVSDLDVLAIRYETLWNNIDIISDYAGFPVLLPPKRERQAKAANPEIIRRAQALYGELDAQIVALPDVFRPPLHGT